VYIDVTLSWSAARRDPGRDTRPVPAFRAGCGRLLHTVCVHEAGTTIAGHHLWFSNMMMRAFLQEHDLVGCEVAFCKGCPRLLLWICWRTPG